MAKATKSTKAAVKAVEVELTPEQKAANARKAGLRKLLGTHEIQSIAWDLQYNLKSLQSEIASAKDNAARCARDFEAGYISGSSYSNNEGQINALQAQIRSQFQAMSSLARNSVRAHEAATALGAQIEDNEIIRLVRDTEAGPSVVAVLPSALSPEFEVFPLALLFGMGAGTAVYVAEAV